MHLTLRDRLRGADRDQRGFTLVELLVAITIVALLGGIVLTFLVRALNITTETTNRVDALTRLQQTHERMSRNIRSADPIDVATATTLTVNTYGGGDRQLVTYEVVGTDLVATTLLYSPASANSATSTSATTILEDVTPSLDAGGNPLDYFEYQTATGVWNGGAPGATPSDIRTVTINLATAASAENDLQMTTGVHIRNHAIDGAL